MPTLMNMTSFTWVVFLFCGFFLLLRISRNDNVLRKTSLRVQETPRKAALSLKDFRLLSIMKRRGFVSQLHWESYRSIYQNVLALPLKPSYSLYFIRMNLFHIQMIFFFIQMILFFIPINLFLIQMKCVSKNEVTIPFWFVS